MIQRSGIIFVCTSLRSSGEEHALFNLAHGLIMDGKYAPVVVCLRKADDVLVEKFEAQGIRVYRKLLKDKYDARILLTLLRLIREHQAKIVVAVGGGGERMFWSAIAARLAGVRMVVWSQTFSQPGHGEFEIQNRSLYPLVDKFVALGQRHATCLALRDKVPPGKIFVISHGIELDHFSHPLWRDRARSILGLADENILAVAMIANFRPSKRQDIFIEAAKRVVQTHRDVHFFVIGDGPKRASVRSLAESSELLGHNLSLLGRREDISQLLPGLDLVCVASEFHECQSMVALQAMASGAAVISNYIGSMDEAIIDNETGYFYSPLSAQSLAEKILQIISNPALRKQIAENSKKTAAQKFTSRRLVNDFTKLFDQLLEPKFPHNGELAIMSRIG